MPQEEGRFLISLLGYPLDHLDTDGCSVHMRAGRLALSLTPEEIATPDPLHPHGDVVRVRVERSKETLSHADCTTLANSFGVMKEVLIASTVISFSPPQYAPPTPILPAGTQYGPIYRLPTRMKNDRKAERDDESFGAVDIGVLIVTDKHKVLVSTDGVGYFVHTNLDHLGREKLEVVKGFYELVTLSQRLGEV